MKRFLKSFLFAWQGLKKCLVQEKNFQILYLIALFVIAAGFYFSISTAEWIHILICVALVLSLEIINSVIEKLCDFVSPTIHPSIKTIKDMAAGAVLLASIISFIIGCIIFFPKIIILFYPL